MSIADGRVLGMTQISGTAPRNRAFNIVLLGDGFQSGQQTVFDSACTAFVSALRATRPFNELMPAINIFRINVQSTDTGADDPVSGGGTGATARTYFDATFGGNGIRRLLVCSAGTVLRTAAAQVPEFTLALLVVNSTIYGGSGGSVGTFSLAARASEIAIHEAGHTAFGLADEYAYYVGGFEPGQDHHPAREPDEPNVTVNTNRSTLKWGGVVAPATALPTMSNPNCSADDVRASTVPTGTVGAFEGAHYYHCGAFRPEYDCKMRTLGVPFCRICLRVIWNRFLPLVDLQIRSRTPISVIARYPENLDVFAVDASGRTMSDWWEASSGWAGWFHLSGGSASAGGSGAAGSPVTSVSRHAGHLDVFTVGTDNRVYSAWWDRSSGWSRWFALGTMMARPGSTVNVVSRATDHLDLFTIGADGKVMSCWWKDGGEWSNWFNISGGRAGNGAQVTAVARHPLHLDLFTVGTDKRVWSSSWDDRRGWSSWFRVGSQTARSDSSVNVVSRHRDQLDLFTTAEDGKIVSTWWNTTGGWGNWFQVSGGVASAGSQVTAVARYGNHLDVFTVGTDRRIYSTWWHQGAGWARWFNVAGGVATSGSTVTAVARHEEQLDLFAVGTDGKAYSTWWNGARGWGSWFAVGIT